MDEAVTETPITSFEKFQKACESHNPLKLLADWQHRTFYTVFVREASGTELPAIIDIGEIPAYVASTEEAGLEQLLTEASANSDHELVVNPVPLVELARSASYRSKGLFWPDNNHLIEKSVLDLLGNAAIVQSTEGKGTIYSAVPVFFEPGTNQPAPAAGSVQIWQEHQNAGDAYYDTSPQDLVIYDDGIDWRGNRELPILPDTAIPGSSLSESGKALFERIRTPIMGEAPVPTPPPLSASHGVALIDKENRAIVQYWRHLVDREMIPPASEMRLLISRAQHAPESDGRGIEYWVLKLCLPSRSGQLTSFVGQQINPLVLTAHGRIPNSIGTHPVSPAFRERLVSQLTWVMFGRARWLWPEFHLDAEALDGLFPIKPDNCEEAFLPDYEDNRYPFLARLSFGKHELPALVLGQMGGDLVCKLLMHASVPEDDIPATVPNRSDLIVDGYLHKSLCPLVLRLPESLVDFPTHWYQGARACRRHMILDARKTMFVNQLMDPPPEPDNIDLWGSEKRFLLNTCAIIILVFQLIMLFGD